MNDPVVVTGIGVTAPNGVGTDNYWNALLDGKSGIAPTTSYDSSDYPCPLAGEVRDFDAADHIPGRLIAQTDHMTHLALAAAQFALDDAGTDPRDLPEYEMAVMTANSTGGTVFGQRELERLWSRGPEHVSAYMSIAWFYAASTGQISIRHGMRGPCGVYDGEQAGGLDVLGHSRRQFRDGVRLVVAGGTDASLAPGCLALQITTHLLTTRSDPSRAYLPFDVEASGYVPGQGGAMLILEPASLARRRGAARVYAEVAGYASTFDPRPGSGREPGLRRAVERALADAGTAPEEIDVVFADAYGVPELDAAEARAITSVFGPHGVPVTAPKTMTGRLYAGGGALDAATAALSITHSVIPPTAHVSRVVPDYELDLVHDQAREAPVRTALVLARGFGGFNSALVLRAHNN